MSSVSDQKNYQNQQPSISQKPEKRVTDSKKNYQFIWKSVFMSISIFSAILINKIYIYQTSPIFQGIRKGSIKELLIYGLPYAVFFTIMDLLIHKVFDPLCLKYYISTQKYKDLQSQKKRSYTIVKWTYSIIYYVITSICGYLLIKDTSFMPTWLGGNGSCIHLQLYMDSFDEANIYVQIFYVLQFGKHLSRFFSHIFIRSDGNFYQYALHHGLSTFLIFFSYLMNMWLIGIFILLIHDLSDLFLISARAYRDYRNYSKKILEIIYVFAAVSWIGCRIILFSSCCVFGSINSVFNAYYFKTNKQITEPMQQITFYPYIFMAFMLFSLQILHLFWTYYIMASFVSVNISEKAARHTYD